MKLLLTVLAASLCFWVSGQIRTPQSTEIWKPVPPVVTPGEYTAPPSDAIVLFDGSNLDLWQNKIGKEAGWIVENGCVTVKRGTGSILTKKTFADIQLHIEWRSPEIVVGKGQGRGNSGIFLMNHYEVQVLDSYENPTYSNGQAASIYKEHIPLVNACKKPAEWQTYDIIFTAPRFGESGRVVLPAYVTVIHNGVLVQNHVAIWGKTNFIGAHSYKPHDAKLPLSLQNHGNPVSYRNIWIREL